MKKKVRIIPVFRKGKGHEDHPDGFVVHPDDRVVRKVVVKKPSTNGNGEQK